MRGWLEALPDELIRDRPVLSVGYAGACWLGGELEGVEDRLRDAERWLDTSAGMSEGRETPSTAMVVVDDEELRRLPGSIAVYRAALAQALRRRGRHRASCPAGARTRPRGRPSRARRGSGVPGARGLDERGPEAAHRSYADGMAGLQRAGHISDALGCADRPGGHPGRAGSAPRRAAHLTSRRCSWRRAPAASALRGTADMHVGISRDLPRAQRSARRRASTAEEPGAGRAHRAAAEPVPLARRDGADPAGARGIWTVRSILLNEAERLYVARLLPRRAPGPGGEGTGVGRAQGGWMTR